jgi:hypothetical protein
VRQHVERYAKFFGVSVDWLLTGNGEAPQDSHGLTNGRSHNAGPGRFVELALSQEGDATLVTNTGER